jgi:hypothetical protein
LPDKACTQKAQARSPGPLPASVDTRASTAWTTWPVRGARTQKSSTHERRRCLREIGNSSAYLARLVPRPTHCVGTRGPVCPRERTVNGPGDPQPVPRSQPPAGGFPQDRPVHSWPGNRAPGFPFIFQSPSAG